MESTRPEIVPDLNKQPTPELFEILKRLDEHHQALRDRIAARSPSAWSELADADDELESLLPDLDDELTYREVHGKIVEAIQNEQAKSLKVEVDSRLLELDIGDLDRDGADREIVEAAVERERAKVLTNENIDDPRDPKRVWQLQRLERQFDPQRLRELPRPGEEITDDNYVAVKAEHDADRDHPIHMVCREVSLRADLSPGVVHEVAGRLRGADGLGAWTEYGELEWDDETQKPVVPVAKQWADLSHVPKTLKELDCNGSTEAIWQKLVQDYPDVVAEVWGTKPASKKKRKRKGGSFSDEKKEALEKDARQFLKYNPKATREKVAAHLGVAVGYVSGLNAWQARNKPAAPKSRSVRTKPKGHEIAIEEGSLRQHRETREEQEAADEKIDEGIDEQKFLNQLFAEQRTEQLSEGRPARKSAR